ncbi:MAG: hypothetical protein A2Y79_11030 [Deltaproteobacteria bacterium RBG_13_43_22]|nr:MAG: hypothetical protein A2Y79_11030 [Deltaproteobacteria bacterium RBG_13_43_22]
MEKIDRYLQSPEFLDLADRFLYQKALENVEHYFKRILDLQISKPIKKNQVKGLQITSNEKSFSQLYSMAKNQLEKARLRLKDPDLEESRDTIFWSMVCELIDNNKKGAFALKEQVKEILETQGLGDGTKKEKKVATEKLRSELTTIFFEHFCCHYYYLSNKPINPV